MREDKYCNDRYGTDNKKSRERFYVSSAEIAGRAGIRRRSNRQILQPLRIGHLADTEAEKQEDGDWLLFGYIHIHEWEWGYVLLSELRNLRLPFGMTIERDLYSSARTVREHLKRFGITV